jgi:hypothetical protein
VVDIGNGGWHPLILIQGRRLAGVVFDPTTKRYKGEAMKIFPLIGKHIKDNYENNTIGARIISNLVHSYFINEGELTQEEAKQSTFQTTMSFGKKETVDPLEGLD